MIGFSTPWLLAALAALPVLWWLLRLIPPSPRLVRFPAITWLYGLQGQRDTAARTPWWLLLLRLIILALIVAGSAGPVLHPEAPPRSDTPLLLVIDDGWAAARAWDQRRQAALDILAEAGRRARPIHLLATAPPTDGAAIAVLGPMTATSARAVIQGLEPKPWPTDHAAAAGAVSALGHDHVIEVMWIGDGIDSGHGKALATALQSLGGGVTVLTAPTGHILRQQAGGGDPPVLTISRLPGSLGDERLAIRATDGNNQVLGREEALIAAGQTRATVPLRLPAEVRNRLTRVDIENETSAATTLLLDENWKRRVVALAGGGDDSTPLLAPLYYVERALSPHAELIKGEMSALMSRRPDALIVADLPLPDGTGDILKWVEQGGVLVRFAGPATARMVSAGGAGDGLLPVRLRAGGRSLGGAMSWTEPQALAGFAENAPLAGLRLDPEIRISAQVLAEPAPELAERGWAHLSDGTPLITAARRGQGWLVLIHTSANAAWSNLPLSGVFPDLMRRLIVLGHSAGTTSGTLAASEVLDGFGRRHPASGVVEALPADHAALAPSPQHPPGLYGPDEGRVAFNLGPRLADPVALALPSGITVRAIDQRAAALDLSGSLLAAALVLLVLDQMVAVVWRGWRRPAAVLLMLGLIAAPQARAAPHENTDDAFALRAVLSTRLAFVHTGDGFVDGKTRAGLTALSRLVGERSTARLDTPMAVDLERDPVLFFPIVYWPLSAAQKPPSAAAMDKLNAYLRSGGMIVLDTGVESANTADPAILRNLTQGLAVPPLIMVDGNHVLTRSFYLLKELPGRWDGAVWVAETGGDGPDGVSPVVVGGNDWAGAWALDGQGRPSFPCVPGGERQRELAWRFGVNLVMYALTGNYKADQVHLPAILERLGQ
ncbi:N-terminal double-transmembrane domain protein [Magnetospirillum gryphiswaldense MSR-1 v2]|uniref:N-terminal double-transmembrane domain protein n=1 Tax=Magnetospirillum gryphiswaldense (strain DSM 6361 / JCM 21280 / NBRC 15271 / MSR-1) TaxID=431944 RepID=V6F1P3_MAGGM|nr:DUF4159 domain-containing protein [Magnetospirillum gryphiswaldense]CDK99450.1 N-terminal double-transmembrane domain protein [Magnetospirillum gryphiswaldense MSR-1 v2]